MSPASLAVALLCLLITPLAAHAQGAGWAGKRVITKPNTPLRDGDHVIEDAGAFCVYKVTEERDGLLRLEAQGEGIAGWVAASRVIPYDQAIDYCTRAIRANPRDPANYLQRGNLWAEKGASDKAMADYNEAIRIDPGYADAYMNRGSNWSLREEYDKAIADYSEAIRIKPTHAMAYYGRGLAWSLKKAHEKAIADYNEAIRIDPRYAMAYGNRGLDWYDLGKYDKAIADYSEAIRLNPRSTLDYINRGNARVRQKDYDAAISDYAEVIRIDPDHFDAYYNRADVWSVKKEHGKAIADYSEAIRIDPTSPDLRNTLAWILATCPDVKIRDGKRAVESATKACELSDWKDANSIDTLAAAYAEAGDFGKAVEHQTRANGLFTEKDDVAKGEAKLKLFREKKPYRDE